MGFTEVGLEGPPGRLSLGELQTEPDEPELVDALMMSRTAPGPGSAGAGRR